MKEDFDSANNQVRRLMEVAGGSADAYEAPPPPPREEPAPPSQKENPFGDPAGGSEDNEPDPLAGITGEEPTPTEEAQVADDSWDCGSMMGDDHPSHPSPLGEEYEYHSIVDTCGELKAIWNAFTEAAHNQQPTKVTVDSGTYEVTKTTGTSAWFFVDPVKDRGYMQETGNLTGHLKPGELFIWVSGLADEGRTFGYIHRGYVFLHK